MFLLRLSLAHTCVAEVVLSLTAPKLGIKEYAEEGRPHWLGGRFISA
jgi:hypothetical protein